MSNTPRVSYSHNHVRIEPRVNLVLTLRTKVHMVTTCDATKSNKDGAHVPA